MKISSILNTHQCKKSCWSPKCWKTKMSFYLLKSFNWYPTQLVILFAVVKFYSKSLFLPCCCAFFNLGRSCDGCCSLGCEAPHPRPGLQSKGAKGRRLLLQHPICPFKLCMCPAYIPTLSGLVWFSFVGLAYQGKDIVFRFIIEYSSLRDFGPLSNRSIFI